MVILKVRLSFQLVIKKKISRRISTPENMEQLHVQIQSNVQNVENEKTENQLWIIGNGSGNVVRRRKGKKE